MRSLRQLRIKSLSRRQKCGQAGGAAAWDRATTIVLPGGVDGIQLAERAQSVRPTLEVIYMTGYAEHGALEGLNTAYPGRVLHKPFHNEDLASLVRAVLDRR